MGYATTQEAWKIWSRETAKTQKVAIYQLADGTYLGLPAAAPKPTGAQRLKPQPAYLNEVDPREGTQLAMKKLEAQYPHLVKEGCRVAVQIAKRKLTVHSREVRDQMEKEKLIGADTGQEYWLGAVMNKLARGGVLEFTGEFYKYTDASRGVHERMVKIWQLKSGADTGAYE